MCNLDQNVLDDNNDFRRAIHECQRIMGIRQLRRIDPDRWPTYDCKHKE